MDTKFLLLSLPCLLLAFAACEKRETPKSSSTPSPTTNTPIPSARREWGPADFDVCGLITKEEVEAIQGFSVKETKSAGGSDGDFRISQCFFLPADSMGPVVLSMTKNNPDRPGKRTPREFWKETFGRHTSAETKDGPAAEIPPDHRRRRQKEAKAIPPKKIEDVGDEAYWTAGALYVLKNDIFIRIAMGGRDNEETKLKKSKLLAEKALSRL